MGFVNLHNHTAFSFLDGFQTPEQLVARAKALGQQAVAVTEHGNLHSLYSFMEEGKKQGVKTIPGIEFYVVPDHTSREKERPWHLTVLAQDQEGLRNLYELNYIATGKGFYGKPRVDKQLLFQYSKGLIVLSGCLAGELARADFTNAKKVAEKFAYVFGDRYYLEIMPHRIKEQIEHNKRCHLLSGLLHIPTVATADAHYSEPNQQDPHNIYLCISTGTNIHNEDRMEHTDVKLHLPSEEEVTLSLGTKAVEEAGKIADRCNVEIKPFDYILPNFSSNDNQELERQCFNSLKDKGLLTAEYHQRLMFELSVISKMNYSGYMLIVADYVNWARRQGIATGPGRGSAAGSLIAYALGITKIDPIKHGLLFERFLNPDRVSQPDIDQDICIKRRSEVYDYIKSKYGELYVSQISTFGTLQGRAAIKDTARALGYSASEGQRIANMIPEPRQGFYFKIPDAIEAEPQLKAFHMNEGKQLIDIALAIEGFPRHVSTHAAGVIISDRNLMEVLPLSHDKAGQVVTAWDMKQCEKMGLVKFDLLGLKTLSVLDLANQHIERRHGKRIDIDNLDIEDPKVYQQLSKGNTAGVFQLESSGITDLVCKLKPTTFSDLTAILALYRPGPLESGMVDTFIKRKHKKEVPTYFHEDVRNFMEETYGVFVYQEQIMKAVQVLAGYTLGEADLLRRAMGKKDVALMAKERDHFVEAARKVGKIKNPGEVFNQIETFAAYGFNKSHSAAYAMVTYQTAYLKTYYPTEFMAALLSFDADNTDKLIKAKIECEKIGIKLLPPCINESVTEFTPTDKGIRFGLSAVKGLGDSALADILPHRPFKHPRDLIDVGVGQALVGKLIDSGSLDVFTGKGITRASLHNFVEEYSKEIKRKRKKSPEVQMHPEYSTRQILKKEYSSLGFFVSGHPTQGLKLEGYHKVYQLPYLNHKESVRVVGVATAIKTKSNKKGFKYSQLVLEDDTGTINCMVWSDTWSRCKLILESGNRLSIKGKIEQNENVTMLIIDDVEDYDYSSLADATEIKIEVEARKDLNWESLSEILNKHLGDIPVVLIVGNSVKCRISLGISCVPCLELFDEIERWSR